MEEAPLKTGDEAEGEAEAVPEGAPVARAEEVQALEVTGETPVGTTTGIEVAEAVSVSGQMVVVTSELGMMVVQAGVETAEADSDSGQMEVVSVVSTVVVAGVGVAVGPAVSVSGQMVVLSVTSTVVPVEPEPALELEPAAAERPNWVEYWYWPVPSTTRRRP